MSLPQCCGRTLKKDYFDDKLPSETGPATLFQHAAQFDSDSFSIDFYSWRGTILSIASLTYSFSKSMILSTMASVLDKIGAIKPLMFWFVLCHQNRLLLLICDLWQRAIVRLSTL